MKKYFLILTVVILTACSSNDEEIVQNPFIGTSWTASDEIANLIYGPGCTTTIEFLTETTCQRINYRPRLTFNSTVIKQGTYTYTDKEVTWILDGNSRTATVSGSVLTFGNENLTIVYRKD